MRVGRNRNGCKKDVWGHILIFFILHTCMHIIIYPSLHLDLLKQENIWILIVQCKDWSQI